jgi:hypothetical protein
MITDRLILGALVGLMVVLVFAYVPANLIVSHPTGTGFALAYTNGVPINMAEIVPVTVPEVVTDALTDNAAAFFTKVTFALANHEPAGNGRSPTEAEARRH